jgi:hypothetical protein
MLDDALFLTLIHSSFIRSCSLSPSHLPVFTSEA